MSIDNLRKWFALSDADDRLEGAQAYPRYRQVMQIFVDRYGFPLDLTTAAFVALSPNTDYLSNLRSLVSVLAGLREGRDPTKIVVSTYNHNRDRAVGYLTGKEQFDVPTRGRKIISFYDNILNPETSRRVTVDGHMVALWRDEKLTMREAAAGKREYEEIEGWTRNLAFEHQMRPCEMQAVLWFTRKRVLNIKYDGQLDMFADPTDKWGTIRMAENLKPYGVN